MSSIGARSTQRVRQASPQSAAFQELGGIMHNLKNFIVTVFNYSDLLLEKLKPEDPLYADLLEIKKAAIRASALASRLVTDSQNYVAHSKRRALAPRPKRS